MSPPNVIDNGRTLFLKILVILVLDILGSIIIEASQLSILVSTDNLVHSRPKILALYPAKNPTFSIRSNFMR